MAKHILLTGGAGFIGSHTYVALISAGYNVTILDNFENSQRGILDQLAKVTNKAVSFIECDIRSTTDVLAAFSGHSFDAVIHFAARKSVPESQMDPLGYYESNCTGLLNIIAAMRMCDVQKIVFSSSAAIYGTPNTVPIPENSPPAPQSVYAKTKLFGENLIQDIGSATPDFIFGILRYFNPVGAHASGLIGENPSQPPTNLVPVIARVAMRKLPLVNIFGGDHNTIDGTCIRDYIHVEDLARGHVLSINALFRTQQSHQVNLGTGKGHSVLEVIEAYEEAAGCSIPYQIVDRRAGDPMVSIAETEQAKSVLGFEAKYGLLEMCSSNWAFVKKVT